MFSGEGLWGEQPPAQAQGQGRSRDVRGQQWLVTVVCGFVHCSLASYVPFQNGMRTLRAGRGITPRDSILRPPRHPSLCGRSPLQVSVLSVLSLPSSSLCLPVCLISLPLSSSSSVFHSFLTCFFPIASVSVLSHAPARFSTLALGPHSWRDGEVCRWSVGTRSFDGLPFSGSPIIGTITPCHLNLTPNP